MSPAYSSDSWTLGYAVTASDFLSLDTSLALIDRNTDGNLPATDLFRLAPGCSLIDAGVDVGIPFKEKAPDLGAFENAGATGIHQPLNIAAKPDRYYLGNNYPNPFNPSTTITVGLPERSHVLLCVFDILGREIAILADGVYERGYQKFTWSGKTKEGIQAMSGVYFYKIESSSNVDRKTYSDVRKMVLIK